LDCTSSIASNPVEMVGEIIARRDVGGWNRNDVFTIRGGLYPFVMIVGRSDLMPGDVVRFVGVERKTASYANSARQAEATSYLDCDVRNVSTYDILSSRYANPKPFYWTDAVYGYHEERLHSLYGDKFIDEIAKDRKKLDHPALRLWLPETKKRIARAARRLSRSNPTRKSPNEPFIPKLSKRDSEGD
jgi:hypothetical protein